jgi:hypothetical protein
MALQFLTLELDGGVWVASHPSHFTASERALGTHWMKGPRGEDKNLSPLLEIESQSSSIYPVHSTNWAIQAQFYVVVV